MKSEGERERDLMFGNGDEIVGIEVPIRSNVEKISLQFAQMSSLDEIEKSFESVHRLDGQKRGGFLRLLALPLFQRRGQIRWRSFLRLVDQFFDQLREEFAVRQVFHVDRLGQHIGQLNSTGQNHVHWPIGMPDILI